MGASLSVQASELLTELAWEGVPCGRPGFCGRSEVLSVSCESPVLLSAASWYDRRRLATGDQ